MALYGPSTATASVAANTNAVTITAMDLTIVTPGMTINFGARDRKAGDSFIIGAVAASGTSGGTLTLAGSVPSPGYNSVPFVIDTTGYLGTDASYAAATNVALLSTLLTLFGPATNLYSGARQLFLDKVASTAIGRIAFATAGRAWADLTQRAFTYTPTGGAQATIETLALRAFPDGTTPTDALLIDLTTGAGDLRKASVNMASAATVDLGSAPTGKVAITGSVNITSFGAGKHLERLVRIVDGGGTIVHNATSLILLGGANIITRQGDCLHVTSDGSGNWRCQAYHRADGTPLILPAVALQSSFRNRIINGDFRINQRGAVSSSTSYAAGAYIMDRWKAGTGGVTLSFTAVANGDVVVTITAGSLMQVIEGALYMPDGGLYTLSWVGTAQARFYQGAAPAYRAGPFTIGIGANTNTTVEFSTGTVALVQFEPGGSVSPFERRDDELRRCQRYFQRGTISLLGGAHQNGAILSATIRFSPRMAVSPSLTYAPFYEISAGAKTFAPYNPESARIYFAASAAGTNIESSGDWTASAEL